VVLYCVCNSPWDAELSGVMIGCDGPCNNWYHPECIGLAKVDRRDEVNLVDASSGAPVDQAKEFLCPSCESTSATPLAESSRLFGACVCARGTGGLTPGTQGARLTALADAMEDDVDPEALSVAEQSLRVRWKLLLAARRDAMPVCAKCRAGHHPLLPCVGADLSGHAVDAPVRREVGGEDDALIVSGKYQGFKGRVQCEEGGGLHGWHKILLDDGATLLHVHRSRLVALPGLRDMTGEHGGMALEWKGVQPAAESGACAFLDLGPDARIPLGRFASGMSAARGYDVAARLQFGSGDARLNFESHLGKVKGKAGAELWDKSKRWADDVFAGIDVSSPSRLALLADWAALMCARGDEFPPYVHVTETLRRLRRVLALVGPLVGLMTMRVCAFLLEPWAPGAERKDFDEEASSWIKRMRCE
jgi:hypothetical protein